MANNHFITYSYRPVTMSTGVLANPVVLTDNNTAFVSTVIGNDNNAGTRTSPVQTITKANTLGKTYILHRGLFSELANFSLNKVYIADGEDSIHIENGVVPETIADNYNFKFKKFRPGTHSSVNPNCIGLYVEELLYKALGSGLHIRDSFIVSSQTLGAIWENNTCLTFKNYCDNTRKNIANNSIFINDIDLFPYLSQTTVYPVFTNCLFRKQTIWKWNGSVIPITYGESADDYILDLKNSLTDYANNVLTGAQQAYLLGCVANSFTKNLMNFESCKIADDDYTANTRIFNRYSNGTPIDYSLRINPNNIALYMSTNETFVGCFSPNLAPMTWGEIEDIDADGIVTANEANMLVRNSDNTFTADASQDDQFWNRVSLTNTLVYSRGYNFIGINSIFKSGVNAGFYFGKKQPFDAINTPVESVEVIPYEDLNTESSHPRFSARFTGDTRVYYHLSDNSPVLFSDLATLGITTNKDLDIYGGYAVSEADVESFLLKTNVNVKLEYPRLRFVRLELNLHYTLPTI